MPVHAAAQRHPSRSAYHSASTPAVKSGSPTNNILQLQRTIGNYAVNKLLNGGSSSRIQRTVMTSAEFLAEGGEAKKDIKLPGFGTVKKQSSRYKAIVQGLDRYHRLITKPLPRGWKDAKISLVDPYDAIKDLGKFTKAYIDEHQSEENPLIARNSVVLELWKQIYADRLIFEGLLKLMDGPTGPERLDEFMTGKGHAITTLKDLLDQAPQSGKHDEIAQFFGLQ